MVRTLTFRENNIRRCSNEIMEVSVHGMIGTPKLRWSNVIRKYIQVTASAERIGHNNMDIDNSVRRPQIRKMPNKNNTIGV